jgi:hypothetical protein
MYDIKRFKVWLSLLYLEVWRMVAQRAQRARLEQASKLGAKIIPFKATFPVTTVDVNTRAD